MVKKRQDEALGLHVAYVISRTVNVQVTRYSRVITGIILQPRRLPGPIHLSADLLSLKVSPDRLADVHKGTLD